MITINTKANTTTIGCNFAKCKAVLTVEGVRSRRKGYVLAINSDWRWKNANTHFCPAHKPANIIAKKIEAKVTEKVANKVTKTAVKATVKPVVKPVTKKVTKAVKPVVNNGIGVAVPGMVAKSAKRATVTK